MRISFIVYLFFTFTLERVVFYICLVSGTRCCPFCVTFTAFLSSLSFYFSPKSRLRTLYAFLSCAKWIFFKKSAHIFVDQLSFFA